MSHHNYSNYPKKKRNYNKVKQKKPCKLQVKKGLNHIPRILQIDFLNKCIIKILRCSQKSVKWTRVRDMHFLGFCINLTGRSFLCINGFIYFFPQNCMVMFIPKSWLNFKRFWCSWLPTMQLLCVLSLPRCDLGKSWRDLNITDMNKAHFWPICWWSHETKGRTF